MSDGEGKINPIKYPYNHWEVICSSYKTIVSNFYYPALVT